MFGIGMQELAIILVVALLIFGPKRLPELAKTFGKGLAEFRKASNDLRQSFMLESDPTPQRPSGADPRDEREPPGRPDQLVDADPPADVTDSAAEPSRDLAAEPWPDPAAEPTPGPAAVNDSGHGDLADEEDEAEARARASTEQAAPTEPRPDRD